MGVTYFAFDPLEKNELNDRGTKVVGNKTCEQKLELWLFISLFKALLQSQLCISCQF